MVVGELRYCKGLLELLEERFMKRAEDELSGIH
jgi:hypothetical protein